MDPLRQRLPRTFPKARSLLALSLLIHGAWGRALVRNANQPQAATSTWYTPPPGTTFFWQLQGTIRTSHPAEVFDIDGWDASASTITALHKAGKRVMCYFSVGSFEDWRSDASQFPNSVKGAKLCAEQNDAGKCVKWWAGERWLDIRSDKVRGIMENRFKMAANKGCDGIEPDNVDAFNINTADPQGTPITKFRITQSDEVSYLKWLAQTAHKYGMSIGIKNSGDLASDLVDHFDWALSEECNGFTDFSQKSWSQGNYQCDYLNLFVKANKAAFVAEYSDFWSASSFFPKKLCADNNAHGFSTAEYDRDLGGVLFPAADCLSHQAKGCADKTWKECSKPTVYQMYDKKGSGMADYDMIGQCVRAKASQYCTYV